MGLFRSKRDDTPREVYNLRLWIAVTVFAIMGAARGLDEGLIGTTTTLPSFSKLFRLKDPSLTSEEQANRTSNIVSMLQIGCVPGALVAFLITDKIGRLWAVRQLCIWWAGGIAIFLGAAATGNLGMVYAGRFIAGIGVGQTAVVAPAYLAEISPRPIRGMCVGLFAGGVYLGTTLGYFAVYGCSVHISNSSQAQWVVANAVPLYVAALTFTLSFFALESPRWLLKKRQNEQAITNLTKLRHLPSDHVYLTSEISDVKDQLDRERHAVEGNSRFGTVKELLLVPSNQYRLFLTIFAQLLSQWSGGNSITIYAPMYFSLVGITGQQESLLATGIFGIVKFIAALLSAFLLVDLLGRKKSLSIGIILQCLTMLYIALFLTIDRDVASESQSNSQKKAATGAVAMVYLCGVGWAAGWNQMQYLINAEMYPLRLRAFGGSLAMTIHFANQYGNSKAIPEMFVALRPVGTTWFNAAITAIGFVWVWFFLPETSKQSLEAIDNVFNLPWYLIGRNGGRWMDRPVRTVEK